MMEKLLVLSNEASHRAFSMCGGLKSLTVCCFQRFDSFARYREYVHERRAAEMVSVLC